MPEDPARNRDVTRMQRFSGTMGRLNGAGMMLCLGLGACGPLTVAPINPDGDYRGSATRFQSLNRTCPRPGLLTASVRDGVTYYKWAGQFIPVSVRRDGTVSGSLPGVSLTGTHDGTTIQGDVTDGQCGLHFTLKRVGT
jgi:hypothetical protein